MTCKVDPADPQLQQLAEGGAEHRRPHDRPPLPAAGQKGDFAAAKGTYDDCVDLLSRIPGNRPVAFRMPCCDSQNTPSPRFCAEIFNKTSRRRATSCRSTRRSSTSSRPTTRTCPASLVLDARRPRAVPQVPAVPVVRQHDRELPLSLRDRQALLGVPLRRPQRLGGAATSRSRTTRRRSRT